MKTLKEIGAWIEERYSENPLWWTDPEFHCFSDLPAPLRNIEMTEWFEVQLQNGGAGQVLWNTYYHWRTLLNCCLEGYREMGFQQQAEALAQYEDLFSRYAHRCKQYILKQTKEGQGDFEGFMDDVGEKLRTPTNRLFYSESGLRGKKAAFVEERREYFLDLMRSAPPHTASKVK